jgi:sugar phosphate isomerase/epimerase
MDGIMNKLAFSTLPCDGWTPSKLLHFCTEYGFSGIELRESESSWVSAGLSRDERLQVAKMFETERVKITDIAASICFNGSSENTRETMEHLKSMIHLAEDLKAGGIRIFLGSFSPSAEDPRKVFDFKAIAAQVQQACDEAAQLGREIWIETHNEFSKGLVLRDLLDRIDRKNCRIIWDIMHTLEDGEKPEDTLKYIGRECVHVHIKDGIRPGNVQVHDWIHTMPGSGEIPVKEIINLLGKHGYHGYYSLEWESKWRRELQGPGFEAEIILPFYAEYMKKLFDVEVEQG